VEFPSRKELHLYLVDEEHQTFGAYVQNLVVEGQVIDYVDRNFNSGM